MAFIYLDALCCCQANNVPSACLGYCLGQEAEYTEWDAEVSEEDDDEKNEPIKFPPFWFLVKNFNVATAKF